jgi:SH3 domain-containing YSC84-like protein 1
MKKQVISFFVFCSLLHCFSVCEESELNSLITSATRVLVEIQSSPDSCISSELLKESAGIAIFPALLKGGYIVGGQYGKGIISHRDGESGKWSPPAFYKIYGGSFGLQAGLDQVDLILLFSDEKSFEDLLSEGMSVGVNIAATAGPVGREFRNESAIKNKGASSVYSYSRSKGLFAGIAFSGAKLSFDYDSSKQFYNDAYSMKMILKENEVEKIPDSALELMKTITKYSGK